MPVNISFTALTDDVYLFQDKDEANAFYGTFTVPDATTSTYGVVKKAQTLSYTFNSGDNTNYVFFEDQDGNASQVPTKAAFDSLAQAVQLLVSYLKTSGAMNS